MITLPPVLTRWPCRPTGPVSPVKPLGPGLPRLPISPLGPGSPRCPLGPSRPAAPLSPRPPGLPYTPRCWAVSCSGYKKKKRWVPHMMYSCMTSKTYLSSLWTDLTRLSGVTTFTRETYGSEFSSRSWVSSLSLSTGHSWTSTVTEKSLCSLAYHTHKTQCHCKLLKLTHAEIFTVMYNLFVL